jgi:hypothetical protein
MPLPDDEFREKQVELMETQIDLYRKQARWEVWKALAAFIAGVAVFGGLVLAVSNYLRGGQQTQFMFPPGTVITIPAAPSSK